MGMGLGPSVHGAPAVTVLEAKAEALNALPRVGQDPDPQLRVAIRRYLSLVDSGVATESDATLARLRAALA